MEDFDKDDELEGLTLCKNYVNLFVLEPSLIVMFWFGRGASTSKLVEIRRERGLLSSSLASQMLIRLFHLLSFFW